jgi:hypothetical protein
MRSDPWEQVLRLAVVGTVSGGITSRRGFPNCPAITAGLFSANDGSEYRTELQKADGMDFKVRGGERLRENNRNELQ